MGVLRRMLRRLSQMRMCATTLYLKGGTMPLKLHRENVRGLYRASQRCGISITQLLNLIVAVALEELEHAPTLRDEPGIGSLQGESGEGGVHPGRPVPHAHHA